MLYVIQNGLDFSSDVWRAFLPASVACWRRTYVSALDRPMAGQWAHLARWAHWCHPAPWMVSSLMSFSIVSDELTDVIQHREWWAHWCYPASWVMSSLMSSSTVSCELTSTLSSLMSSCTASGELTSTLRSLMSSSTVSGELTDVIQHREWWDHWCHPAPWEVSSLALWAH